MARENCYWLERYLIASPHASPLPIEIKAGEAKDDDGVLSKLAQVAFDQIEEKKYDTELRSLGVSVIHKYGIAFANKRVELKTN